MKSVVILFALLGVTFGIQLNGLRVTFGWSEAMKDREHFFTIPLALSDAEKHGFRVKTAIVDQHGLTASCLENDFRVCPLYDKLGTIAGLQISIPADDLKDVPEKLRAKLTLKKIQDKDYYTVTQYLVPPAVITNGGRPSPITSTLGESLWVHTGNEMFQIPLKESEMGKVNFRKQNCIPNMGTHYYRNLTPQMDCNELYPFFILVKEGQVIGTGFQIFGKTNQDNMRPWFETLSSKVGQAVMPDAPVCLRDNIDKYGMIIMHIYYVNEPWDIRCEESDSVQPISVTDKLLLDTTRYANKAFDGVKKIFSG